MRTPQAPLTRSFFFGMLFVIVTTMSSAGCGEPRSRVEASPEPAAPDAEFTSDGRTLPELEPDQIDASHANALCDQWRGRNSVHVGDYVQLRSGDHGPSHGDNAVWHENHLHGVDVRFQVVERPGGPGVRFDPGTRVHGQEMQARSTHSDTGVLWLYPLQDPSEAAHEESAREQWGTRTHDPITCQWNNLPCLFQMTIDQDGLFMRLVSVQDDVHTTVLELLLPHAMCEQQQERFFERHQWRFEDALLARLHQPHLRLHSDHTRVQRSGVLQGFREDDGRAQWFRFDRDDLGANEGPHTHLLLQYEPPCSSDHVFLHRDPLHIQISSAPIAGDPAVAQETHLIQEITLGPGAFDEGGAGYVVPFLLEQLDPVSPLYIEGEAVFRRDATGAYVFAPALERRCQIWQNEEERSCTISASIRRDSWELTIRETAPSDACDTIVQIITSQERPTPQGPNTRLLFRHEVNDPICVSAQIVRWPEGEGQYNPHTCGYTSLPIQNVHTGMPYTLDMQRIAPR